MGATTSTRGVAYTKHLDETLRKGVYETQIPNIAFLYEHSSTRSPEYQVGDRVCLPDGRVFRYGKAGADDAFTGMKRGCKNYNPLVTQNAAIVAAAGAGDESVTITFDGDFWDVALTLDSLRGGYISIYNSGTVRDQRGIVGNTAVADTGGECTIYLDAPISTIFTSAVGCEIMTNPYSNLRQGGHLWCSIMGMPCSIPSASEYFWIQTWGICRISPVGAELGVQQGERQFVFDGNGTLRTVDASDALDYSEQVAGFLIERTNLGAGSAAPFIMLQISP